MIQYLGFDKSNQINIFINSSKKKEKKKYHC